MPKSFKFKSLHVDILKDHKNAHLKKKHNGTFRHIFEQMVKHSMIFRVEPIFAAVRRGQPH